MCKVSEVPPRTGRVQRAAGALGGALGYTCRAAVAGPSAVGGGESPARVGGTRRLADEGLRAEG